MQTAKHTLADLIDLGRLQRMCDGFAAVADIGLAVLDPAGAVLVSAGWQDICKDFHRVHKDTLQACTESDRQIDRRLVDGIHGPEAPQHYAYRCANGLWDVAFPLIIAGEHLANLFTGQFFYDDDRVDVAAFRSRARRLGFDEAAYLEALARVPVLAHERVAQTISFLADFVGMLGDLGLAALRQEEESAALRESEARLEESQSIARLGRWELDLVGDRLHWSNGIFALFEIDPARFGASYEAFLDAIHPDDRGTVDRAYSASLEDRQPYQVTHRLLMKDGRVKWVHERCRTDFDAGGRPLRSIGVVQEVTEQMRAEAALRESEEQHRTLFESMPQGVVYQDSEGRIIAANPSAERILGLSLDQMQGRTSMDPSWRAIHEDGSAFPGDRHPAIVSLRTGRGVSDVVMGVFNPTTGSYRWMTVNAVPQFRPGASAPYRVFTTFDDITERKQAEEERLRLERQLLQLQKSESLARMAGAIAHHFNNQLQAVIGNLDLVLEGPPQDGPSTAMVTDAMQAARRAAEMSSLMLTYLGQIQGTREALDLSAICLRSLPQLQAALPEDVGVDLDAASPGPIVRADARQLQQVLANLTGNAGEAMGEGGGSIRVSVTRIASEGIATEHRFPLDWQPQDAAYACLEVADTGCGIAPQDMGKLFDPFFTGKFIGRGLGLPVVLGIVAAHGGAVTVESRAGRGSVFRVYLRLATREQIERDDDPGRPVLL